MRTFALLLLAASSLVACAPKTCEPQPVPEEYKEIAPLLPASTVVCGPEDGGKSLFVNFKERDVKKLALETTAQLKAAGWNIRDSSNPDSGHIVAFKGPKASTYLDVSINSHNGGPYAGRVTGTIRLHGQP